MYSRIYVLTAIIPCCSILPNPTLRYWKRNRKGKNKPLIQWYFNLLIKQCKVPRPPALYDQMNQSIYQKFVTCIDTLLRKPWLKKELYQSVKLTFSLELINSWMCLHIFHNYYNKRRVILFWNWKYCISVIYPCMDHINSRYINLINHIYDDSS